MHRAHSTDPWTSDDKKLSTVNMRKYNIWKSKSNNHEGNKKQTGAEILGLICLVQATLVLIQNLYWEASNGNEEKDYGSKYYTTS